MVKKREIQDASGQRDLFYIYSEREDGEETEDPVEEAARMSVVSRRWYELWKKAIVVSPRLEFYYSKIDSVFGLRSRTSDNKMLEYVNRVNQVLKLHKPPTLDEFTVAYPLHSKYSQDINKWVEFAAKKQVKKLALNFCIRYQSTDKEPSYDCDFLTSSGGIKFHKLRDLHLKGVDVTDNVIHCLLSNSPLIERLCVIDSQRLHNLQVTASNLRYLVIRRCEKLEYVKIYAPNLNVLKLHPMVVHFSLYAPNLSRLSVVFSRIVFEPILRTFSDYFQELFAQFSHVKKRLSITIFPKVVCTIARTSFIPHPELSYVEHLKVRVNSPWPSWYKATTYSWFQGILWPSSLVKAAPSLHKLSLKFFHRKHKLTFRDIDVMWMFEDIPKKVKENVGNYSHQNLKIVELIGYTGVRYEIQLLLHLVEIAASLEKLVIHVCVPNMYWFEEDILRSGKPDEDFLKHSGEALKGPAAVKTLWSFLCFFICLVPQKSVTMPVTGKQYPLYGSRGVHRLKTDNLLSMADLAAKFTVSHGTVFVVDEFSMKSLPFVIVDSILD
ncbi:hypothetical protein FNV43_RR23141 [Rhamnella rubrinervis]|uniref:At1g61320/AtMIF1 LRR domain-containing protein n=1 Tax=Rhamnella rubrinervis TaxID=2594499 RepID=A0A8K0DXH6_9ROSA|nr:hypothetical protein FNV43_RR23141 [Rhamnella rubrinervis]